MSSSSRVKRLLRKIENLRGNQSKKRRVSGSDAESSKGCSKVWTPKSLGDLPVTNIYNSTSRSPPAELFRKDLISAMKLPDNEPLSPEDYWFISDAWKQEWERGVQVPVNPEALPISSVRNLRKKDKSADFKLPKKLVRITHDEFFSNDFHQMINAPAQAEKVCRYDLDDCDLHWLIAINEHRQGLGLTQIKEASMENVIEVFETQCYENMQESILAEAGLGIEYDEDVICDVCRSPDSEEGNEMVFCDACDICVHQACYGITAIPEGSWLCRTCSLAIKPNCILCPNKGGAMKSTRSGQKWAHVSCALWIPEVSIGCVEKMEPITKIAHIPPSRWALICCLCRDRLGACIQCSVKSCKTAYHVTCGFQNGLDMKALVEDENMQDEVKLRSYCPKHSKNKDSTVSSDSDEDEEENSTIAASRKETSEDKASVRAKRIQQIESAFYKHVTISEVAENSRTPVDVVELIYQYWKLKRRAAFNKPLLIPRSGENDALGQEQEDCLYARMKMFVHLRQDLERVRNLCYMVTRREKLSRSWYRLREQIFQKQLAVLTDPEVRLSEAEQHSVVHACHGKNIYDRLYTHNANCCVEEANKTGLDSAKNGPDSIGLDKGHRRQRNLGERQPNPYAKTYYFNGVTNRSRRRSGGSTDLQDASETKDDCIKTEADSASHAVSANACDDKELVKVDEARTDGEKREAVKVSSVETCMNEEDSWMQKTDASQCSSASPSAIKLEIEAADNNNIDAALAGTEKEMASGSKLGRKIELIDPPLSFNPAKSKAVVNEHSPKGRLRNGCHSSRLDKKSDSREHKESVKDDAKDDVGRDTSSKENEERQSGDGAVSQGKSDKKSLTDEKLDGNNLNRHRHRKAKLLKMQQALLQKSPTEKTSPKSKNKKTSPSCEPTQFRDKMRQESAKIRESLFSNSFKGSLAGYRIPKKFRSESESDTKQEEEAHLLHQQQTQQQLQQSPPPPIPLASPQQHAAPVGFPVWKEHKSPPEMPPLAPQALPWNSNMAGCSTGLLPTPSRPPIPMDRRLTRRDRGMDELLLPPSQVNGRDNGFSPRLVIKLRKDPNYPESPRWRRDGDIQDVGIYDFKGEQNESPPNIRLKLNATFDKSRYEHSHRPVPLVAPCLMPDLHSPNKRVGNKYSMRTRTGMDMQPLNSSYS